MSSGISDIPNIEYSQKTTLYLQEFTKVWTNIFRRYVTKCDSLLEENVEDGDAVEVSTGVAVAVAAEQLSEN